MPSGVSDICHDTSTVRQSFFDNPIGGLAMYLVGPLSLRLALRGFVVIVGVLMLAGAVNTAIVGSNGVLNRVSEDGILPDWFRRPHRRFGTSYRILNLVVGLQLLTIVLSGGNMIRPISKANKAMKAYMKAARKYLRKR